MSDDPDVRYRKAKETLENIGWVFTAFIQSEMTAIMKSDPTDTSAREEAYRRAVVATKLKAALTEYIDEYENQLKVDAKYGPREQQHYN